MSKAIYPSLKESLVVALTGIQLRSRLYAGTTNSDDLDLVAGSDLARCSHLGINPAIAVAESAHQRFRDVEVADAGQGIDVGGGAADDALDDFEAGVGADAHLFADKIELDPGRPACDIDIAAEA